MRDEWQRDEPANHRQRIQHASKNQMEYFLSAGDEVGFGIWYRGEAVGSAIGTLPDDLADMAGSSILHTLIVAQANAGTRRAIA